MIREAVSINEDLCNGCGDCVPACLEGALQIIDGKARLISDLLCDGLGACLGHCPMGAISVKNREAEAYDEIKVMEMMIRKGKNTVIAHLKHLKEHNQHEYLHEGVRYLQENRLDMDFSPEEVMKEVHNHGSHAHHTQGCPGSAARNIEPVGGENMSMAVISGRSELRQWPVQLHLINPAAGYFQGAELLLAADCVPFTIGDFHQKWLKGKSLAIACPKLDDGLDSYIEKIRQLIDDAGINTVTVMMMQVPCCGGLLRLAQIAQQQAKRKVPLKMIIAGIEGNILKEEWI